MIVQSAQHAPVVELHDSRFRDEWEAAWQAVARELIGTAIVSGARVVQLIVREEI